jgi:hypothetical protein
MARQPNWRRVKRNRNYTYEEAARLLEAHPRTVRNWVQRDGLAALPEQRPHLISLVSCPTSFATGGRHERPG